ncbi:helix-turn-helix domain-containing protein [Haladaptatus sp. NG-SE-30]
MSFSAEFTVSPDSFALGRALHADRAMTIELERTVPTEERVLPYFVAWNGIDYDSFEKAARSERAIRSLTRLDEVEGRVLYRVEWNRQPSNLLRIFAETNATLLQGRGTNEEWYFRFRFPDQNALSTFRRRLQENDIEPTLDRLHSLRELQGQSNYGLTPQQKEALRTAFESGYFDQPRESSQRELADRLDITSGAVSGRLQRGLQSLVANTLMTTQPDE